MSESRYLLCAYHTYIGLLLVLKAQCKILTVIGCSSKFKDIEQVLLYQRMNKSDQSTESELLAAS